MDHQLRKLLVVDDDEKLLCQLKWALHGDYDLLTSTNENHALTVFKAEGPQVTLLDLSLDSSNPADLAGMRILENILSIGPATRVIVITGNSEDENALKAIKLGAFDFYSKPIRLEELKVMIQRAFHIHSLQQRVQEAYPDASKGFHGIIGRSKAMREVLRFVERVAVSDISVLICGESGTGKEVVAHAIHQQSQRTNNPFVVVNCAAIPENLLESELFGHEKGAFTGAHAQKRGKFELADGGTLFLDEIGELVPALQVKLLRFLQDRKIERIGSMTPVELDVRIIAATNRDLKQDMEKHMFREDLYYRLKVVPLDMPPLRNRKEDIIPLALHFLKKFCQEHRKPPITLSPEAEGALLMHPWPGNVRELENLISRAVVMSPGSVLKPGDLGFALDSIPTDVNLRSAKQAMELDFVKKALERNRGIVSRAARELGISRVNLYELIDKYKIRPKEFKTTKIDLKAREDT